MLFLMLSQKVIFKNLQTKACANVFCIVANSLKNSLVVAYFKISRTRYLTLLDLCLALLHTFMINRT